MTLRQAHEIANQAIAANVSAEDALTDLINQQIDAGLSRLLGVIRTAWPTLTDTGSLQLTEAIVAATLGNALYLLPNSRRSDFIGRYSVLTQESYTDGVALGSAIATLLLEEFTGVNSTEGVAFDKSADAVRRLYNHVEDFRRQVISAVLLSVQNGAGLGRVQDVVSAQAGKVKGKAQGIAAFESHDALIAGVSAAYALMGDGIEYEVWNTSQAENVCAFCLAREGNVYKKGDVIYPAHQRGRCFPTPYSPSWDDPAFRRQNREAGFAALEEAGLTPNYGATGLEKAAGLDAPKPFLRAF